MSDDVLRLVNAVSAALADSHDLDEVLATVGRVAVPRLGDACVLALDVTPDGIAERRLIATSFDAETEALAAQYLERFAAGSVQRDASRRIAAGESIVWTDLGDANYRRSAHSDEQLALLQRLQPRSALTVPLRARGRSLGTMTYVTTNTPRTPSDEDMVLARELGHRVAEAVYVDRVTTAARDSEHRLALALGGTDQGFWDWDLRANRLWVDARLCALLGRDPHEFTTTPEAWNAIVHPTDLPRVRAAMREHIEGLTTAYESEHRMLHADGSWRWVLSRGRIVERDARGQPVRLAGTHSDVTARRRGAESREVLAQTVESDGDFVATFTPNGTIAYVNPAGLRLLGATSLDAVRGRECASLLVDEDRSHFVMAPHELGERNAWTGLVSLRRVDDAAPVRVEARLTAVRDPETAELIAIAAVMRDLTERHAAAAERERLAEQARHAQRIESLGVLAGGVAHDFNNLLTVILSTLDLARSDLPRGHSAHADLDIVRGAASRASQLTRQLLAFSRRQVFSTRLLELNAVVGESHGLLRRIVGERVAFGVTLAPAPLPVRADPVQLEQVLVNLVLNARDAVTQRPDSGGLITVDTDEVTLGTEAAARLDLPSGPYVALVVHDTGVGMDDATRSRVFEPFFTTKSLGAGTGLGLSMVYGIVAQSGGAIDVESVPGRGSTFRVLLPRAESQVDANDEENVRVIEPPPSRSRGGETVLLVEDEAAVRGVARRILERAGYTVLEARHGADALLVWREQGGARGAIDVLITDVRMPELGGRELAAALRRERPSLPIVFVSGYQREPVMRIAESIETERFVEKPFVAPELQTAVRQVLDAAHVSGR